MTWVVFFKMGDEFSLRLHSQSAYQRPTLTEAQREAMRDAADVMLRLADETGAMDAGTQYNITNHALQRFMERSNCKSEQKAMKTLRRLLSDGTPVILKPGYAALALMNHNYRDVEYLESGGWILVISEDKTLLTVHNGQAGRWQKKK